MSEDNNINLDQLSGEDNQLSEGGQANVVSDDIDALFGEPASDEGASGGSAQDGDKDPFGDLRDGKQPDYTGMSHEELAKMFQSKFDKAQAELQRIKPRAEKTESLESFVNELYEKPEVRRAFLAQVEPDLVKPKDPYAALEEQLKTEFGEDFVPDEEEAKRPFSTSWRYYRKIDDLTKQAQNQKTVIPQTLEEIRTQRKKQLDEQKRADAEMKGKVLSTMKWSDNDYKTFADWVYKLSALDLAKVYNYAQKRKHQSGTAPNLVSQTGGTAQTPNEIASELRKFFG